jgi:hypothetical protein
MTSFHICNVNFTSNLLTQPRYMQLVQLLSSAEYGKGKVKKGKVVHVLD